MNFKIFPVDGGNIPAYTVELHTPKQPFYHTAFRFTGTFGYIDLSRADLPGCTIWNIHYETSEPVRLYGITENDVYQLCFPVTGKEDSLKGNIKPIVFLSIIKNQPFTLSKKYTRVLCIHYSPSYFKSNGGAFNGTLSKLFPEKSVRKIPIPREVEQVCFQILDASPAHRIVHLYLEAKTRELLTLLYHQLNPVESEKGLSEKEIESIIAVRNIILSDLSVSHTSKELARMASINIYNLKRNFRTYYGVHLNQFQHNCRMEKATELLLRSEMSIKEIAFSLGYKALSNFSESFKKHFGYPPSKLRQ